MSTTIDYALSKAYCSLALPPMKRETNRLVIDLNNRAISALQCGNVLRAFELLSEASNVAMDTRGNHKHAESGLSNFSFHWEDCSMAFSGHSLSEDLPSSNSWQGTVPFLFLRGLQVGFPPLADIDGICSCSFAWVILYNLALCCSLLGTRLGDRGYSILKLAFDLYSKVQERIDMEPGTAHWNILQMSVLNNQACIYYDFSMHEASSECLHRLAKMLFSNTDMRDVDRRRFILNLQILGGQTLAPAA
jgi:hypothetical protein